MNGIRCPGYVLNKGDTRGKIGVRPLSYAFVATIKPVCIKQEDFIQSVTDALQYISYYHPVDYIRNLATAYEREESPAAKDAIAQILINSRTVSYTHLTLPTKRIV